MLDFAGLLCQSRNWNRSQRRAAGISVFPGPESNRLEAVREADRDAGGEGGRAVTEHDLRPELGAQHEVAEGQARAGAQRNQPGPRRAPGVERALLALLITDVVL